MKALIPLVLLCGCAAVPVHEKVKQVSDIQVCEAVFFAPPHVAAVARDEAALRRINCADYQALVMQHRNEQAARNAAMGQLGRQLMTPPPAPAFAPLRPFGTTCRTIRMGDMLQTQCD